jgi:YVTN family beta-propeller protein
MSIVDVAARRIVTRVLVGGEPEGTAISPDGRIAVQASESGSTIHVVDAGSGAPIDNFMVDTRPRHVAFTPDGKRFWVSSEARGTINVYDSATRRRVGRIDFKAAKLGVAPSADYAVQPVGIVFTRDGRHAYIGLGRAKLAAEVDPAMLKIVRTFPVGWRAWNVALSPDERRLYTANGLSGDVTAIDLQAGRVIGTVRVGGRPWGIRSTP